MSKLKWLNYSSFSKNSIIAALDIGSSKVCCLIGKLDNQNNLSIIGAGFHESKGLVSGIITDPSFVYYGLPTRRRKSMAVSFPPLAARCNGVL